MPLEIVFVRNSTEAEACGAYGGGLGLLRREIEQSKIGSFYNVKAMGIPTSGIYTPLSALLVEGPWT
jgi:hypothetical protein